MTVFSFSDEDEEEDSVSEDEDQEIITVVYFWQGRDASEMGWLHFTHGYNTISMHNINFYGRMNVYDE